MSWKGVLDMGLWQMSWSGGVLILVVMGIRMVARDWLPKRMFLVLWWVVLLRLLLPFSIPSGWSVYTFVGNHTAIVDRDERIWQ